MDKEYSSENTGAGGKKLGKSIDVSEILPNLLDRDAKIAENTGILGWVGKVNTNKDWDLKNNQQTVFGVAWSFDEAHQGQEKTNFNLSGLGLGGSFNAADVGN